ncbi:RNA recognition motif domain [Dillenia turbinata]|uniref:RNA recognition motif domain n=1 Tax=Dillenia turbinata TaxID=194707 RepID=A0AAN8V022_9MAGN
MDDMAAYYQPPPGLHNPPSYPYYQLPPPPPATAATGVTHQYHPQQPPPPPFASYALPPYPSFAPSDQVRTLFIAGLPEDVKPREIYILFREFPGYESSHLRSATTLSSQPFAFATFRDQQSALAAIHALNGMVFDLERESTLHIDLAKSNSRSKRSRTDEGRFGEDKRAKPSSALLAAPTDSGIGSVHLPGMGNSAHNTTAYPSTQSYGNVDGRAANGAVASKLSNSSAPPCPTLFVANLGPTCSEQELIQVFSRFPGFLKLKMQHSYGAPVAFVDFQKNCSAVEGARLYLPRSLAWVTISNALAYPNWVPVLKVYSEEHHFLGYGGGDYSVVWIIIGELDGAFESWNLSICLEDTACSTGALNSLQGTILYSSPTSQGMRLEYPLQGCYNFLALSLSLSPYVWLNQKFSYAKSRMGLRRKQK